MAFKVIMFAGRVFLSSETFDGDPKFNPAKKAMRQRVLTHNNMSMFFFRILAFLNFGVGVFLSHV